MTAKPLIDASSEREFGGKAAKLSEALRAGLPVPQGFALDVELVEAVAAGRSHDDVARAFEALGGPAAVRSSAIGEDSAEASFAGQHLTILNVTSPEEAIAAVRQVRESAHTDAARAYRLRHGLTDAPRMAVVLQRLVNPDCAGVMFTRNPVDGSDERVIEAACGLGETVVAGLVTPDAYRLARDGRILEIEVGEKHVAIRPLPGGGTTEERIDGCKAEEPCLTPQDLARLNDLATRCEDLYGPNLDIEWVLVGGRASLVQCRAITTFIDRAAA